MLMIVVRVNQNVKTQPGNPNKLKVAIMVYRVEGNCRVGLWVLTGFKQPSQIS